MSLLAVFSNDEHIVGPEVHDALLSGVERSGSAVLLVPSYRVQAVACRELATTRSLSLGVKVLTPAAWVQERWEVWGDGTHVVDASTRTLIMQRALEESSALSNDAGTLKALERLASEGFAWMGFDASYRANEAQLRACGLTTAERQAVRTVGNYAGFLRSAGYVELCEAAASLPDRLARAGVGTGPVVLAGFISLRRTERELARGLARLTDVRIVVRSTNARLDATVQNDLLPLVGDAQDLRSQEGDGPACMGDANVSHGEAVSGFRADYSRAAVGQSERAPELDSLLAGLFGGRQTGDPAGSRAARAVGIVLPSGPHAEAEAVAQALVRADQELSSRAAPSAGEHRRRVVVSAPDGPRAWRELAPKLGRRGFCVRAELSLPVMQTDAGRAFFEFAETVAELQELDASWPLSEETTEGTVVRLGSMTWWPPRRLVDFLMSGLSGMPAARAMDLDRSWRQNRLLTPHDVLEELQSKKAVPSRVEAATRELLRGRLGSAASKLLAPLVAEPQGSESGGGTDSAGSDTLARAIEQGVLVKVLDVANTLRRLGISVAPEAQHSVSLATLVRMARLALDDATIVVRPELGAQAGAPLVELLSPAKVAQLEPCSADVVVLCGQTSVESPVGNGDNEIDAMLANLDVERQPDPMALARRQFVGQLAVARSKVLLERTLVDAGGKESYASVMLSELLAWYGVEGNDLKLKRLPRALGARGLLFGELPETDAFANSLPDGSIPHAKEVEAPAPAGVLQHGLLPYVVVPPNGRKAYEQNKPVLSASQIETYLECPFKWFSLRRLGLDTSDARFSGAEMGTFVHKVLEITHRDLLQEALERLAAEGGLDAIQKSLLPRVPGCRVSAQDPGSLTAAQQKLAAVFERERVGQYLRQKRSRSQQPLVPHTSEDQGSLNTLRRDLLSTLEYEADKFVGYEPRLFEWKFGRKGEVEEYAGVPVVGSIDRVDVDEEGRAVVIDYKHKSPYGFAQDYGVFGPEGFAGAGGGPAPLPRHVQALMYAQVLRRRRPDLTIAGSVYLCTKGAHALTGAVSAGSVDRVFGSSVPSSKALPRVEVPTGAMNDLLDATEAAIALKVKELLAGNIEANPVDARACDYCPVLDCEKRMS